MSSLYNLIAGQSIGRLASLSDGIFAVAMTLLVLRPATYRGLWRSAVSTTSESPSWPCCLR